jgi:tetratricopeptide (TPR) repeat protein
VSAARSLLLLAVLARVNLAGQQPPVPPRPALGAGQDTNSAEAYVAFGMLQIPDHPKLAGDAFFWATRLDPSSGAAWYGRWAAQLLDPDTPAGSYAMSGTIQTSSAGTTETVEITAPPMWDPDSLRRDALLRDPLLYLRLDFIVADQLERRRSHGGTLMGTDDPALQGQVDYSIGRFAEATRDWARALHKHPGSYGLHVDRARAFAIMSQYDSAVQELRRFLAATPTRVEQRTLGPDGSARIAQYAIGRLHESQGDLVAARADYDGIVAADSGFSPAHAALARLAVARRDTSVALSEYARATLVADPPICYTYGVLLLGSGHAAEAGAQFSRALEADSDYAPPYYPLAVLEESAGFDSAAVVHYTQFIARAPRTLAPIVEVARGRLTRLQGAAKPN